MSTVVVVNNQVLVQGQVQVHTATTPLLLAQSQPPPTAVAPSSLELETINATPPAPAANKLEAAPLFFKMLALLCACLLSLGSHYSNNTLGALKATVKREMHISNAQYSTLLSSVSFVNTFVPILGGYIIDVFGTGFGSLVASSLIMTGEWITAIATASGSYPLMLFGRIVLGLGSGSIVTVQETILGHWFHGKGLAVAVGVQIAVSRLAGFLATNTVVPISESLPDYHNVFLVSASMCTLSFLINMLYVGLVRFGLHIQESEEELKKLKAKKGMRLLDGFNLRATLWLIMGGSFLFGFVWNPFLHISSEFIKLRFQNSDSYAATQSSLSLALPIVISPFLGALIDKYGQRPAITIFSAVMAFFSILLIWVTSDVPAVVSMVVMSISLTFGPIALISAVPLVVPLNALGTSLGLYKCTGSIGSTIMEPLLGWLQDVSPAKGDGTGDEYNDVLLVLLISSAATAGLGIFLWIFDASFERSILSVPAERRRQLLAEAQAAAAAAEKTSSASNGQIDGKDNFEHLSDDDVEAPLLPGNRLQLEFESSSRSAEDSESISSTNESKLDPSHLENQQSLSSRESPSDPRHLENMLPKGGYDTFGASKLESDLSNGRPPAAVATTVRAKSWRLKDYFLEGQWSLSGVLGVVWFLTTLLISWVIFFAFSSSKN